MDTSDLGFWLMIAFWGIAIGGIASGITWACQRGKTPPPPARDTVIRSLKKGHEADDADRAAPEKRKRS